MSDDRTRRESFLARAPSGEDIPSVPVAGSDPGSEPTISSIQITQRQARPAFGGASSSLLRASSDSNRSSTRNHVALPPGYPLQEYTIEAVLGSGGFGITYRARDNNLQCLVAIKEYLPNDLAVRAAGQTVCAKTESDTHGYRIGLDGFLAEARVLATFRHPNIVRVTRFFEANNTAYMVMDYERGESLRDWVKQHGPVDEAQLLRMFLPLLEGLDVVHKANVLHRDIKPANLNVRDDDGSLVLLDFGAARYARTGESSSLTSIVTPGYAPLEQYHTHGAQGPWSDLYALGGVLYWLVTGEKPLEAPSRIRNDPMPSALSLADGRYSTQLLRAIDWALTPDEVDRPKSVSQFRAVLTGEVAAPPPPFSRTVVNVETAPALPHKQQGKPASRLAVLLGAVAVAVLLSVGIFAFYPRAPEMPPADMAGLPSAPHPARAQEPVVAPAVTGRQAPADKAKAAPETAKAAKRHHESKPDSQRQPETLARTPTANPVEEKPQEKEKAAVSTGTVILQVNPQGEVVVDGRKMGNSPPLRQLSLAAGVKHKIEIYGSGVPYYWTVTLKPGERREIYANFQQGN